MKIKILSLAMVTALFLSLCGCGGGSVDPDRHGSGGEIGASPSTGIDPSSSKTIDQPGSGTGEASQQTKTTSSQTEGVSSQTTATTGTTGTTTRALEVLKRGNSTWKEVPIQEGAYSVIRPLPTFDLKKIVTNADYVFSGKVIGRKEYEAFWTDEEGKQWGPYSSSIIEVEVNHDYYGKSPVKGNVIKIHYADSLSTVLDDSVLIKDQGEYVFITRALDDKYVERRKKETPEDGSEPEKYADVYIPTLYYNLLPIDKGTVFAYYQYFSWDKDIVKKVKSNVKTDKIPSDAIENGMYIALDRKEFDNAFNQLFENPEILPSASDQ